MKRLFVSTLGLIFCTTILSAQSVPTSELLERLKLNRSHFDDLDHGEKLSERARVTGNDVVINRRVFETETSCTNCGVPDAASHPDVKRATHESDLVATGHFVRKISALTTNEAFIITDYEFLIEDVWKSSEIPPLHRRQRPGDEITVVLPGGTVESNGHRVSAYVSNRLPIQTGHTYLLYLHYLTDSRSYMPVSLDGLDLTGPVIVSLKTTSRLPNDDLRGNKALFLQMIRASTDVAVREETK